MRCVLLQHCLFVMQPLVPNGVDMVLGKSAMGLGTFSEAQEEPRGAPRWLKGPNLTEVNLKRGPGSSKMIQDGPHGGRTGTENVPEGAEEVQNGPRWGRKISNGAERNINMRHIIFC